MITVELRYRLIALAEEGLCGGLKVKDGFSACILWPGIDLHVKEFVVNCNSCIISAIKPGHAGTTTC